MDVSEYQFIQLTDEQHRFELWVHIYVDFLSINTEGFGEIFSLRRHFLFSVVKNTVYNIK